MTIDQITERQTTEGKVYDIAQQIRTLLDQAARLARRQERGGRGAAVGDGVRGGQGMAIIGRQAVLH